MPATTTTGAAVVGYELGGVVEGDDVVAVELVEVNGGVEVGGRGEATLF